MTLHPGWHIEVKRTGTDRHRARKPQAMERHVIKLNDLVTAWAGVGDNVLIEDCETRRHSRQWEIQTFEIQRHLPALELQPKLNKR